MKTILLPLITVITVLTTSGCVVAEERRPSRWRHERHPEVRVVEPEIIVRPPEVIVR